MRELPERASVVICGAGIAGASCAYHLAVERGLRNVVIVEEGAPLSLTSDKSTEGYRNWWPGPGDERVRFMNRSIDLLEHYTRLSDDRFQMNRRGYLFATANPDTAAVYAQAGEEGEAGGACEEGEAGGTAPSSATAGEALISHSQMRRLASTRKS